MTFPDRPARKPQTLNLGFRVLEFRFRRGLTIKNPARILGTCDIEVEKGLADCFVEYHQHRASVQKAGFGSGRFWI